MSFHIDLVLANGFLVFTDDPVTANLYGSLRYMYKYILIDSTCMLSKNLTWNCTNELFDISFRQVKVITTFALSVLVQYKLQVQVHAIHAL